MSLHPEDLDALRTAVKSSKAANTIRAYQSQCVLFAQWLQSKGYPQPPWEAATPADRAPVSPMLVAAWLQERAARGDSKSTICVALAAVRHGHSITGTRFDRADPVFDEAMKGVRKNAVREEDQAAPLRGAMLADILTTTGATATLLERRNAAMLATLYVLALRRSELAGLDYLVLGTGTGVLKITTDAIELVLLRSKTSQEHVVKVAVPRADNPRAVAAIERWVAAAGIVPGSPLIRRITPAGTPGNRIAEDSVNRVLRAAVERYYVGIGTPAERARELAKAFSGHSGRVGFIVTAKEAGAQDSDIQVTSRHKTPGMIAHYGKQAEQKRRAVHKLPGVGV